MYIIFDKSKTLYKLMYLRYFLALPNCVVNIACQDKNLRHMINFECYLSNFTSEHLAQRRLK